MLYELQQQLDALRSELDQLRGHLDLASIENQIKELDAAASEPDFWSDPESAQKKIALKARLEKVSKQWHQIDDSWEETALLIELSKEENDASVEKEIETAIDDLRRKTDRLTIETLFKGPKDLNNAIVTIHPGAGGTESQDWAQMLMRMYLRWSERKGYSVETFDLQPGDEAGIKSVTFAAKGSYAYGYFKAEAGVHRLVRISPFDANKRRHTSFASVFVSPEIEDDPDVVIDEKDLRIDIYRASGAGGQHVNKTSSAVRITHLPSKIVTQCQNERSQLQNKAVAMTVLKSRLYELQQEKKQEDMAKITGEKKEIGWGNQIRSYVFQPYQMVKDHRTGIEKGNVTSVMDGDIDIFVEGYLKRPK
ncbi:MAG: peptide chain release factor 2 [Nitrospira sp.]|nr:peptide chain release factor 2 [Candidatus Manganitrophaceae bacterium]HIL35228.1 peptide chain release factor 2 [Candidatus Manganitrophaceae bacterium]